MKKRLQDAFWWKSFAMENLSDCLVHKLRDAKGSESNNV